MEEVAVLVVVHVGVVVAALGVDDFVLVWVVVLDTVTSGVDCGVDVLVGDKDLVGVNDLVRVTVGVT